MTEEKKGFKKTEVGLIPEDWDVYELGELGNFKNGINKGKEAFGHGSPFVNLMDVFGIRSISDVKHLNLVDSNTSEKATYSLEKGDVLFVRSSVKPSGVGLTTVVDEDLENAVYSGFLIRFREKGKLYHDYKAYCFHDPGFRNRLIAKSSVSANTNINQESLKLLRIALPPTLSEQQAIATALSDVDELIRSLDELIQKKEAIKKGTMQQLLTGKKRLPGFDGEWEEVRSGDVVEYINGRAYSKHEWESKGTPVVRLQNLTGSGENYYYSNLNLPEKNYMYEGDLIFMWSASFGPYIWKGPKAIYHYHIWKIDCDKDKIDKKFYYHKLVKLTEELKQTTSGSTMLHLTKAGMEKFKLNLPPLKEQKAIAQILSDMDREIQVLRQKREKARQIKQGMMQELLTGKTRLV